mmetsp:Transcript_19277/g.16522  ORF Transcript_19277/g.16522 Transcript_19277/m.16522 type:complete len:119 (-) Transcript_19277:26-382(-)
MTDDERDLCGMIMILACLAALAVELVLMLKESFEAMKDTYKRIRRACNPKKAKEELKKKSKKRFRKKSMKKKKKKSVKNGQTGLKKKKNTMKALGSPISKASKFKNTGMKLYKTSAKN